MTRGRPRHPDVLTPAEWRVLERLQDGRTNTDIAVELGVSINTVKYHVANIVSKLDLHSREELVSWRSPKGRHVTWGWLALGVGIGAGSIAGLFVALAFIASPNAETVPPPNETLYFSSAVDSGIGAVNAVGDERWVLRKGRDLGLSVSPDGSEIAYLQLPDDVASAAGGNGVVADLVTLGLDDGLLRYLDPAASVEPLAGVIAAPRWRPDGQFLAFQTQDFIQSVISADGQYRRDVILGCYSPGWNTAGTLGACSVPKPGGEVDVLVGTEFAPNAWVGDQMPPPDFGGRSLTVHGVNVDPQISSDGRWVAWWVADASGASTVWLASSVATSGASSTELGPGRQPTWSPTRNRLLFSSAAPASLYRLIGLDPAAAPRGDIFVYDSGSKVLSNLTHGQGSNTAPEWSPDGNWIAFISDRDDAGGEVYLMRSDGSDVRRLTYNDMAKTFLVWSPR